MATSTDSAGRERTATMRPAHEPLRQVLRALNQGNPRFLLRQMNQRSSLRLLTSYCVAIGLSGLIFVSLAGHFGKGSTSGRSWPLASSLSNALASQAQGIVLLITAIGGAILVRSPLPRVSRDLLDDFARRFSGRRELGHAIQPMHGALVLARLAVIVPACLAIGWLIGERKLDTALNLALPMLGFVVATGFIGGICGAFATWLGSRNLRWPLTTWFAIWIVPEMLRLLAPESPTCRSIFTWLLSAASRGWGTN